MNTPAHISNAHLDPAFFDHLPLGMLILQPDGRIARANKAFCALLGDNESSLQTKTLADITYGTDQITGGIHTPDTAHPSQIEKRLIGQGGHPIWVIQSTSVVYDHRGDECYRIAQFQDVSTHKAQEHARSQHLELLSRYADTLPGMAAYWNSDLTCAFANGAYLEWFGKSPTEMPGMPMRELLGERLFALNEPYIQGALRGELQQFERTLTKANGETGYTWAQYIPDTANGTVRGFFVLVSDISELKHAQQKILLVNETLKQRSAEAEAGNRAKSLFLSMVSHELRSPLHSILGYTDLLQQDPQEDTHNHLQIIEKSGKRLLRLIDDVLAFSVGETKTPELEIGPMTIGDLKKHLNSNGRLLAKRGRNQFKITVASNLPNVLEADEQRLCQVLLNMIDNACKFTTKGKVEVRIEADGKTPDGVRFSIIDNGHGIAPSEQARIFQPFTRINEHRHLPGIGLGLAISQQLVNAMGGNIEVNSAIGHGSCFTFTLPLRASTDIVSAEPGQAAPTDHLADADDGHRRTALIVEDIDENRDLLTHLCRAWGFRVLSAKSGNTAIRLCANEPTTIDVALVDQRMPDGDGWTFLKEIRATGKYRSLPVIMLTAHNPRRPPRFPIEIKFDAYLRKPFSQTELATVLARLLNLQWQRDDIRPLVMPLPEEATYHRPPTVAIEQFNDMLNLGQVLAIADWAKEIKIQHPECSEFASAVEACCKTVDLPGLHSLFDQISP